MKLEINLKLGEIDMKTLEGSDFLNPRLELTPREFSWLYYALASCDELHKEDGPFLAYMDNNLNCVGSGRPTVTEEEFMSKNQDSLIQDIKYYEKEAKEYREVNGNEIAEIFEKKVQQLKAWLK